tara:strand:- start:363 stop:776 length:414 start_codon:yes stop_codon:yes gene_type:complete
MKTYTDKKGYLRYKSNNRFIHRIVAKSLYNNTKFKFSECLVYHLDLNKKNNKSSNLRIITPDDLSKFKSNLKINPEDTRDLKLQKYCKFIEDDTHLNLCFLEGILRKSKLPVIINEKDVSRLKNEINFERKFLKQSM